MPTKIEWIGSMSGERKEYIYGQQAFEEGKSFLDNPYHSWNNPLEYFSWAKGWWDKNHYYERLSSEETQKEKKIEDEKFFQEQEKKRQEETAKKEEAKYKKSKKGRAEAAGQGTLFG